MASPFKFYGNTAEKITAKFVLVSQDRFCIELSAFSNEAIEIFKTIPSRSYDPKTRLWTFHLRDHDSITSKLIPLKSKLTVEKLPPFVRKAVQITRKNVDVDFSRLDPVLKDSLMPFQIEGLKFGIEKNGRCLIADDMGLGKTFQALAIANYYKENWPVLIVTTSSMKAVWEETIANYLPSIPILNIQYMVSGKDYIGDAKVLIVSHDMMTRALDKLKERNFGVFIIDESHVLKSFKAKCFKSASVLSKISKRVILLSGTPALSRPSELFTQLSLIDSKFFGTFYDFSKRYCDGKTTQFGWDASGKSNLPELEIILTNKFMIRRTKDQVIKTLPNKTQEIVTLDTKLDELSKEDKLCLIELSKKYSQKKGADKHAALLSFFSETAKIKIPAICSYVLKMLEEKRKFLIFAHHQVMMNAIEDIVKKKNVRYIRIDGNTTSDQRKYFISKFQLDDNYRCAILSITAANAGITLTAAQLVLFAELHWNPSILSQAEARAHRIGQENPVTVRYLLAFGTADDAIWLLLEEKQKTLSEVGLCKDSFEEVTVVKQEHVDKLDASDLNASTSRNCDIRDFFTPEKKRKLEDESAEDIFDDGFDDILSKHAEVKDDVFNDGMDEFLSSINF